MRPSFTRLAEDASQNQGMGCRIGPRVRPPRESFPLVAGDGLRATLESVTAKHQQSQICWLCQPTTSKHESQFGLCRWDIQCVSETAPRHAAPAQQVTRLLQRCGGGSSKFWSLHWRGTRASNPGEDSQLKAENRVLPVSSLLIMPCNTFLMAKSGLCVRHASLFLSGADNHSEPSAVSNLSDGTRKTRNLENRRHGTNR